VTASPIDAAVNPNNTDQRYILWNNGRIDAVGGAPAVTGNQTWYDRFEPPAVALHVTDWTTGSGYTLDYRGGFHEFGGAPELGVSGVVAGVPLSASPRERLYVDWSWNPDGSGQGYVLDRWGKLLPFGGATAPPRAGRRFSGPITRRLDMQWSPDKRAITLTMFGGMYGDFAAVVGSAPTSLGGLTTRFDAIRDFVVTDWATGAGHMLDLYGGLHEFGGAPNSYGFPYNPGGDVARVLKVLSAADPRRFWEVWSGGQQFEWVSSTPPTAVAGAGSSEVQTVTITGGPTGGSFTLTFDGATTAAIAFDATAATVDSALEALATVGAGNVSVTGGPGPGTPWTVTFTGALEATDVPQMTATSSLTGGTSPAVAVTTTTAGITSSPAKTVTTTTRPDLSWNYSDPQSDSQVAFQVLVYTQAWVDGHDMSDPLAWSADAIVSREGIDPNARGIACPVDLSNDAYRLYVRVKDTAGQWSAWDDHGWTQNVPVPTAPSGLTATASEATLSVALSVSATTGQSADLIRFDASDDAGVTWLPVRGADAVPLLATTTGVDYDAPLGITRTYRAVAYATDPAVASNPSATATATVTTLTYALTAVDDPTLGGQLRVQEPVEWTRPVTAGTFQGLGADYPTVVKDGRPKSKRSTVHVFSEDAATWAAIESLAESVSTLVYRDPFGSVRYCELVGDWSAALMPGAATRHLHTTDLPLVEVRPPHLDA
jgi:hypothetical protein